MQRNWDPHIANRNANAGRDRCLEGRFWRFLEHTLSIQPKSLYPEVFMEPNCLWSSETINNRTIYQMVNRQTMVHPCSTMMLSKDFQGKQWSGNTESMEDLHSRRNQMKKANTIWFHLSDILENATVWRSVPLPGHMLKSNPYCDIRKWSLESD